MAISLLTHTKGAGTNTFTTPAIDTTGASFLVLVYGYYVNGPAPSISDSKSNTWSALTTQSDDTSGIGVEIHYVNNPTVGTSHTFTATGTGIFSAITVACFSGTEVVSVYDGHQNGGVSVSSTSKQPGSVTPVNDNSLLITGYCADNSTTSVSINSGFIIIEQSDYGVNGAYSSFLGYFVQGPAAAINPTWSWTGSVTVGAVIASFKPLV